MAQPSFRTRGRLVLCPTPLGNLEDITLRVLRCLRECDVIFAEDTRVSKTLLHHYDVRKPVRSFHERVEEQRLKELDELLRSGSTVSVITDAGMPGVSDPGVELVRRARASGAAVDVLPGPSALLGALVLSGFDIGRFRFEGFPPRKSGERRAYLRATLSEPVPLVWYESPQRVRALIADIAAVDAQRRTFVLREYTKKFEEHVAGSAAEVARAIGADARGEFVVVVDKAEKPQVEQAVAAGVAEAMTALLGAGVPSRVAVDALRRIAGAQRNALYDLAQRIKSPKQ